MDQEIRPLTDSKSNSLDNSRNDLLSVDELKVLLAKAEAVVTNFENQLSAPQQLPVQQINKNALQIADSKQFASSGALNKSQSGERIISSLTVKDISNIITSEKVNITNAENVKKLLNALLDMPRNNN